MPGLFTGTTIPGGDPDFHRFQVRAHRELGRGHARHHARGLPEDDGERESLGYTPKDGQFIKLHPILMIG